MLVYQNPWAFLDRKSRRCWDEIGREERISFIISKLFGIQNQIVTFTGI